MEDLLKAMSPDEKAKTLSKVLRRVSASEDYYHEDYEKWKRLWKIYHALKDQEVDEDEPNIFLPTAYGLIEDAVARLSIPTLQRLPIHPKPKKAKHLEASKRFYNFCRDYFGTSQYRLDRMQGDRERCVIGNGWEVYEWANHWCKAKRWDNVQAEEPVEQEMEYGMVRKAVAKVKKMVSFSKPVEVEYEYPERIGFSTRFPSAFDMFPEPGAKRWPDVNWVIEQQACVPLKELRSTVVKDPVTQQNVPVYDLTELEAHIKNHLEGDESRLRPTGLDFSKRGEDISQIVSGRDANAENKSDEAAVHLLIMYGKDNSRVVVCQGQFVIMSVKDVLHRGKLPMQLKHYTPVNNHLFGKGLIEPIEDLIYELNDIHNLAFSNWIRIINKMVVYDESVIKYKDDFDPRAGGLIRANLIQGGRVADAFSAVDHQDVSVPMLNMESNGRGLIERAVSISDLSPGVEGTKQYHKTLGGLMEIQGNLARRFTVMLTQDLSYIQYQMDMMYWFLEQFMFTPITVTTEEGGIYRAEEYTREDINTDGAGFIFVQSEDPSFGDTAVQRNQYMVLMNMAMQYEQLRRSTGDKKNMEVALDEIMRLILESFGHRDTSKLLKHDNGVLEPDYEFGLILQGLEVQVNPREDLLSHLMAHVNKKNDKELLAAIESSKVPPQVLLVLQKHIDDTTKMIQVMSENIDAVAQVRQAEEVAKQTGAKGPESQAPGDFQYNLNSLLGATEATGAGVGNA